MENKYEYLYLYGMMDTLHTISDSFGKRTGQQHLTQIIVKTMLYVPKYLTYNIQMKCWYTQGQ